MSEEPDERPGALRAENWRLANEVQSQRDTIDVLRAGANELAIENAALKIQVEHLRRMRAPER
jgi:regulator of replication initiation timing